MSIPLIFLAFFVNQVSSFFSRAFNGKIKQQEPRATERPVRADAISVNHREPSIAEERDFVMTERRNLRRGLRRRPKLNENGAEV